MANEQNLKPCEHKFTHEEQKKGAKKSAEVRHKKKTMRQQMEMLLELPIKNEKTRKQIKELGINNGEINNQMAVTIALFQKAIKGDIRAYEVIQNTLGENPNNVLNTDSKEIDKVDELLNKIEEEAKK